MERSSPRDALRMLADRNGSWSGPEEMAPSEWAPEGATATGYRTAHSGLDGAAIIGDYRQETDGRVVYAGHSVTLYDPDADEYLMYWFDSFGSPANVFRGRLEGEVFELWGPGPGGSQLRHRSELGSDGTLRQVSEMTEDGEAWITVMRGEYRREG